MWTAFDSMLKYFEQWTLLKKAKQENTVFQNLISESSLTAWGWEMKGESLAIRRLFIWVLQSPSFRWWDRALVVRNCQSSIHVYSEEAAFSGTVTGARTGAPRKGQIYQETFIPSGWWSMQWVVGEKKREVCLCMFSRKSMQETIRGENERAVFKCNL